MTTLAELAAKKAELDAIMKEHGKSAISAELSGFFAKYPDLTIRWTQYTPYFNDGDACTFSIHGIYVFKMNPEQDEDDQDDESELGSLKFYLDHPEYKRDKDWITQALVEDGKALANLLESNSDALEAAFGDHMEVVATASGVEANEYSHD